MGRCGARGPRPSGPRSGPRRGDRGRAGADAWARSRQGAGWEPWHPGTGSAVLLRLRQPSLRGPGGRTPRPGLVAAALLHPAVPGRVAATALSCRPSCAILGESLPLPGPPRFSHSGKGLKSFPLGALAGVAQPRWRIVPYTTRWRVQFPSGHILRLPAPAGGCNRPRDVSLSLSLSKISSKKLPSWRHELVGMGPGWSCWTNRPGPHRADTEPANQLVGEAVLESQG